MTLALWLKVFQTLLLSQNACGVIQKQEILIVAVLKMLSSGWVMFTQTSFLTVTLEPYSFQRKVLVYTVFPYNESSAIWKSLISCFPTFIALFAKLLLSYNFGLNRLNSHCSEQQISHTQLVVIIQLLSHKIITNNNRSQTHAFIFNQTYLRKPQSP